MCFAWWQKLLLEERFEIVNNHKGTIEVCAAVIRRNGKLLITGRKKGTALEGFMEFPGGKVEKGESAASALKRELKEELALTRVIVMDEMGLAVAEGKTHFYRIHFLRVILPEDAPEPCGAEGQEVKWIAFSDVDKVKFLPADREFASYLALVAGKEKNF